MLGLRNVLLSTPATHRSNVNHKLSHTHTRVCMLMYPGDEQQLLVYVHKECVSIIKPKHSCQYCLADAVKATAAAADALQMRCGGRPLV